MKIIEINSVANIGSTGRIAKDLGEVIEKNNGKCYLAYGRNAKESAVEIIKIGRKLDIYNHFLISRVFDRHGLGSYFATKKFLRKIDEIKPEIIHLHNIHGYYVNYKLLFKYLTNLNIPVVWTLHDCWAFTGHCAYYSYKKCNKWIDGCSCCPCLKQYPKTIFDNSKNNYKNKKSIFTMLKNLTIVTPSTWLANDVKKSFLLKYNIKVINNGIDLSVFKPSYKCIEKIILGVASVWEDRKGLKDFIELSKKLEKDEKIVLIGVTQKQINELPKQVIGIERTENIQELVEWYSKALVFVNPTYEDNFPTTNLESLACGTPVITYETGGSPESIDERTGFIVKQGDIDSIYSCYKKIQEEGKNKYSENCVNRAKEKFDKQKKYQEYYDLYKSILNCNNS